MYVYVCICIYKYRLKEFYNILQQRLRLPSKVPSQLQKLSGQHLATLPFSFERVADVLAVGGSMLVVVFGRNGGGGRQVQTPVTVIGHAVLLLHMAVCHLLPQLLQFGWNHACHKQIG